MYRCKDRVILGIAGNLWVVVFDRLFISNYSHRDLVFVFLTTSGIMFLLVYLLYRLSRQSDIPITFQDSKVFLYPDNVLDPELRDNQSSSFTELNDNLFSESTVEEPDESSDDAPNNCARSWVQLPLGPTYIPLTLAH